MAKQSIGIGTAADDGTGDTLRAAGDKINDNFTEIYTTLGDGSTLSTFAATANPTFTGVVKFADGSASAPAITNADDADTGAFFSAANEFAITTGGTERFKVSNSAATLAVNLVIPNAGNIGSVGDTDAIAIATGGAVTFSQRDVHSSGITIADGGEIGSASDTDAISISSAGVITLSSTTDSTSASTGSLVTHSIGVADDASFGDQMTLFGATGKIQRDSSAAFLVLNGTDSDSADAGDNIIIEAGGTDGAGANANDDILLEDQIFHHTGHASVSLTIFDSGGNVVKSLIGVHQDTSEIN